MLPKEAETEKYQAYQSKKSQIVLKSQPFRALKTTPRSNSVNKNQALHAYSFNSGRMFERSEKVAQIMSEGNSTKSSSYKQGSIFNLRLRQRLNPDLFPADGPVRPY